MAKNPHLKKTNEKGVEIPLKPLSIHTVPVYQDPEDNEIIYGLRIINCPEDLILLGWANIHEIEINGEPMFFLAVKQNGENE